MEKLKSFLLPTCRPIIVTDAGFRVPWFRLVESLDWDYIGRVRNNTFCKSENESQWHPVKDLYGLATRTPKFLGAFELSRAKPIDCNMVVYKKRKKNRKDLVATGDKSRNSKKSRSNAQREREPWLLATSLSLSKYKAAKKVVNIYRTRMQIEESFRDCKTGLNMNSSNTRAIKRLEVLLLIAFLAQYILFLIGIIVVMMGKHRQYQANTEKSRNVLSFQFIGLRAVQDPKIKILKKDRIAGLAKIQTMMEDPHSL